MQLVYEVEGEILSKKVIEDLKIRNNLASALKKLRGKLV